MKKYIGFVLVLFFVFSLGVMSFAQETGTFTTNAITTNTTTNTTPNTDETITSTDINSNELNVDGLVEKVTIEDAEKWAERKGFEIVGLLQKVVQPFAIIIFILSAFMSLAGAFGNSQLVGRGIWGMFIAVIMYAVVLYAPEILDSLLAWLTS